MQMHKQACSKGDSMCSMCLAGLSCDVKACWHTIVCAPVLTFFARLHLLAASSQPSVRTQPNKQGMIPLSAATVGACVLLSYGSPPAAAGDVALLHVIRPVLVGPRAACGTFTAVPIPVPPAAGITAFLHATRPTCWLSVAAAAGGAA
jgi:hypothetical protein